MVDDTLSVYPSPSPAHCPSCPFREPCILRTERGDAEDVLATSFRPHPPEEVSEGRLGGVTWGLGRGAAPPHLGVR